MKTLSTVLGQTGHLEYVYSFKHKSGWWLLGVAVAFAFSAMPMFTQAQTLVSGNISGTWSPSGNPYIVTSDATVPSGQTLTIQPGVIVWIGLGVSITANGVIQAVGNPTTRITFQSPATSQFWNRITVNGTADVNRFKYCDFQNADYALVFNYNAINEVMYSSFLNVTNGISMSVGAGNYVQTTKIMNCVFSNCVAQAVYGQAYGAAGHVAYGDGWSQTGTLIPVIKNCYFNAVGGGVRFLIYGGYYHGSTVGNGYYYGYGYSYPQIMGNLFCNVTNAAISMEVGSYPGGSPAALINNTLFNCGVGLSAADPWDAKVQSCIFVGCTNAVQDAGVLSRAVSYNCFYQNTANFTGYNANYGNFIIPNRNGTLSDILYNFSQNPLFVATNDFHLATNSPCIDAGTPDWAYSDMCFTNLLSQGTSYPDLGAYGGPDAVNWLDTVPKLCVEAFMTRTNGSTWLNWGALPRSSYQVQYLTNLDIVGTNAWTNFGGGLVLATDKPTSLQVATGTATNKMFFRVQSLGRAVGN